MSVLASQTRLFVQGITQANTAQAVKLRIVVF